MAIIGIDLGTTNSLACVFKNGEPRLIPNAAGQFLTPSCVGLDDDKKTLLVGRAAKDRLISKPDLTAADFKRLMGSGKKVNLADNEYSAQELSSMIIRQLKSDAENWLGEPVTEAVISVPAYFDDNGRNAVKEAGELAGLLVERIVNEPSAAALSYRRNEEEDSTFLIFDFGGGTLDVTVVEAFDNIIEVVSAAGDNHLGGRDFDITIATWLCRENDLSYKELSPQDKAVVIRQAELAKIALDNAEGVMIFCQLEEGELRAPLSRRTLIEISSTLFKRISAVIRKALIDAEKNIGEIDKVVMAGGSSKMEVVKTYIKELTGAEICDEIDPDTVVATGVGLAAGIKMRLPEIKSMILTDVCPFSLGVDVKNDANVNDPLFSPIIPRNSALPASREERYYTTVNKQKKMSFTIYQGDNMYCRDNLKLGTISISVPPKKAGEECCEARFSYDINGILEVDVKCVSTGETVSTVILGESMRLSEEEIAEKRRALEALKILPRDKESNRAVLARAEQLYARSFGENREELEYYVHAFNKVLGEQDDLKIRNSGKELSTFMDDLEHRLDSFDVFSKPGDPDAPDNM